MTGRRKILLAAHCDQFVHENPEYRPAQISSDMSAGYAETGSSARLQQHRRVGRLQA